MTSLVAVLHNLVYLVSLNKTLDDLLRGTGLLVDIQSHLWVGLLNDIS